MSIAWVINLQARFRSTGNEEGGSRVPPKYTHESTEEFFMRSSI